MEDQADERLETGDNKRAELILSNVGLSWDGIKGKNVLDVGSGKSALAQAATRRGSTARVSSIDIKVNEKWLEFPWGDRQAPIQADAVKLPFKNFSFDYVIMHGSTDLSAIPEAVRVLRPKGELRIYPMAGMVLEYWYISYYLDNEKRLPRGEIVGLLEDYDRQIKDANGWLPKEYVDIRKEALNNLTQKQKLEVLGLMVKRHSEQLDLSFSYEVDDPNAREPNTLLIYKKEA